MVLPLSRRSRPQSWAYALCRRKYVLPCLATAAAVISVVWLGFLLKILKESDNGKPQDRRYYEGFGPTEAKWTIFYHIFVPTKSHKNALRIVQAQLEQVSGLIDQMMGERYPIISLYYTTTGDMLPELWEGKLHGCRSNSRLHCRHWQHITEGTETASLQTLYDFCLRADPDQIVTYLHSKGTYHHHKVNERWRTFLTNAALHRDCVSKTTIDSQCNVCGLHFYTQWTNFFPGNMWTSRCEYIRELLPPEQFSVRQEQAVADLLWLRYRSVLASTLFTDRLDRFGLERYSMEHWIGSHPSIRPCDMAPSPLRDWLSGIANENDFDWGLGPRHHGPPADNPPAEVTDLLQANRTARRMEFFYLPGRIRLWHSLYQTMPGPDSWIWTWFPDGDYWRDQVGDGVFPEHSLERFYHESGGALEPLSLQGNVLEAAVISLFMVVDASQPVTPVEAGSPIVGLLSYLARNPNVELFYQVMGRHNMEHCRNIESLSSSSSGVKALPPRERLDESETLNHLRDYCLQETLPSGASVMYLPTGNSERVQALIEKCVGPIQGGTCNICGAHLFAGTNIHFGGNTWVAKCSYIQKLLPTDEYIVAMNRLAAKTWVESLKNRFVHVPQSAKCLGIDSFAMQSWAMNHPDADPCHSDISLTTQAECDAVSDGYEKTEENVRLRSYSLLAGYLWKLNHLYGSVPSDSSWIWKHLPDGPIWRDATKRYGARDVVERITRPLADTSA